MNTCELHYLPSRYEDEVSRWLIHRVLLLQKLRISPNDKKIYFSQSFVAWNSYNCVCTVAYRKSFFSLGKSSVQFITHFFLIIYFIGYYCVDCQDKCCTLTATKGDARLNLLNTYLIQNIKQNYGQKQKIIETMTSLIFTDFLFYYGTSPSIDHINTSIETKNKV